MWVGNQQFTVRNVTITNAQTAIFAVWNWGWTYQDIKISDCDIGFDTLMGGLTVETQSTGALAILDAEISNTPIFIRTNSDTASLAGGIVLKNIVLNNVDTGVLTANRVVLEGGSKTVDGWIQGNVYSGTVRVFLERMILHF
jgi:glucan 1,3-beta-glucosidase